MPFWEWMEQNASVIGAATSVAMALIWVFYLQIFLISYLRQRRSNVHIDRGAAEDETARCIVTNMGEETVYIAAIVVELIFDEGRERALVTDKDELPREEAHQPLEKTNKGPLKTGEACDVGSFWDLAWRANIQLGADIPLSEVREMEVTVLAASNQARMLTGAAKRFQVVRVGGRRVFVPDSVLTHQIRSLWRRRRLRRLVDKHLSNPAP